MRLILAAFLCFIAHVAAAQTISLPNDPRNGTLLNYLAKQQLTAQVGVTAAVLGLNDTNFIGVVTAGAGVGGTATIQQSGIVPCFFDGPTTGNDYVTISPTIAGACHDYGVSLPAGTIVGQVVAPAPGGAVYVLLASGAGPGSGVGSAFRSPPNNTYCVAGDSLARLPVNAYPLTNQGGLTNRGIQYWVPFLAQGRVVTNPALNFGVNGDTTTGLLTRIGPILAANCGVIDLAIGTNDVFIAGNSLATMENNLKLIVQQLLSGGAVVILSTVPSWPSASQQQLDQIWAYNQFIKSMNNTRAGLPVVDTNFGYMNPASTNGAKRSGFAQGDDVHYTGLGAFYASLTHVEVITHLFPYPGEPVSAVSDQFDANNPHGNLILGNSAVSPFQTGAGAGTCSNAGGATWTGNAQTGWQAALAGAGGTYTSLTVACATVTTQDQRIWQQLTFSGSYVGATGALTYFQTITGTININNINVGDTVCVTGDIQVDPIPGGSLSMPIGPVALDIQTTEAGQTYYGGAGDGFNELYPNPLQAIDGQVAPGMACRTIQGKVSAITANLFIYMINSSVTLTSPINVRVANVAARKL